MAVVERGSSALGIGADAELRADVHELFAHVVLPAPTSGERDKRGERDERRETRREGGLDPPTSGERDKRGERDERRETRKRRFLDTAPSRVGAIGPPPYT